MGHSLPRMSFKDLWVIREQGIRKHPMVLWRGTGKYCRVLNESEIGRSQTVQQCLEDLVMPEYPKFCNQETSSVVFPQTFGLG